MASAPVFSPRGLQTSTLSPPQTPSASASARGLNPLSSKVTAVLSTSYADSEFRDALSLLDERELKNTAETRRQLRLDLQKEVIDSNGDIIRDFGRVAEQLRRIRGTLDSLNSEYQEMKKQVAAAHAQTSAVLAEASALIAQKAEVATKQQLLTAFRTHFILSEDEIAALTLSAEPVDERFFSVLAKAKKISKDCEVLLGLENQTLGLELMEQTSKSLNLAFQKLYKWIQREFKTLNLENPYINSSIRRALRLLAERPSLFQNCLDYFAEARERILSDAFHVALTGTSPAGHENRSVKPIEMAAYDPLRYAGDMLAWIHSATVSEREALESLFISDGDEIAKGLQHGRASELWRLVSDDHEEEPVFDAVKELNDLVDRDVSGAARILRQRVEQVIQSNEEMILSYKLANLLGFYKVTFSKLLGDKALLLDSLVSLEAEALRQFRSLMRDHIATLQGEFQQTPSDLGPPEFLLDALKQLTAIMETDETSLASPGDREAGFEPILAEALEPFMAGCENVARGVGSPEGPIFLINCQLSAIATLQPFEFTQTRAKRLRDGVKSLSKELVESQTVFLQEGSGMKSIFEDLKDLGDTREDLSKMRTLPTIQLISLTQASQILDDFLPSALMDAMENLKHLQDAKLAREITEEAAERFCSDFEHVEDMLIFADGLADQEATAGTGEEVTQSLRAILPRTTGEIRVLLS